MTDSERETWKSLVGRIATGLPPGFIALLLINVIFAGAVLWLISSQIGVRNDYASKLLDVCLSQMK